MAVQTTRQCLCCGSFYNALSAKKFLCGARSCYRRWHKDRQALKLSIAEYKELCKNKNKQVDTPTEPEQSNPLLIKESIC